MLYSDSTGLLLKTRNQLISTSTNNIRYQTGKNKAWPLIKCSNTLASVINLHQRLMIEICICTSRHSYVTTIHVVYAVKQ